MQEDIGAGSRCCAHSTLRILFGRPKLHTVAALYSTKLELICWH